MGVSVIFARGLVAEIDNRGLDKQELLKRADLDPARLADLRAQLTLEESDLLCRSAIAMTDDPSIGLQIGATAPQAMLQIFGQMMLSEGSIRSAFETLHRFSALLADGPVWDLIEEGDEARFTFLPAVQLGVSTRCAVDYTMAMTARIGQTLLPHGAALKALHLQHAAPSYAERYADVFACPVLFEQPVNALIFPRAYLDHQQPHADAVAHKTFKQAAERLLHERVQMLSVAQRVRTLLRYENDLSELNTARIARSMSISVRSLRRRLGSEGTPLSSLLDEARCWRACQELRRPDATIKEITAQLGFSEASAFHRAFKRWTGLTPSEYSHLPEHELPTDLVPIVSDDENVPRYRVRNV